MNEELIWQNNEVLQEFQSSIAQANDKFEGTKDLVLNLVDKGGEIVKHYKEIDLAIKKIDAQVELMVLDYDFRIEKFKTALPVIENQLTKFSNQMDILLEKILDMDPYSRDLNYIRTRTELISILKGTSETLSNMFFKVITL